MSTRSFRVLATLAVVIVLSSPTDAAPALLDAWGRAATDVPADASIHLGTLPNGLRYAIKRNATPKGTISLRMRIAVGSLNETERERGLAHFIEHMAFNGTTHLGEDEMVASLQRLGLRFGPDTNAQTGFDATTYLFDLPETNPQRLDTGFHLLREIASEVKFDPAAVERERGVIMGERRARASYQLEQLTDRLAFNLPDTSYAKRLPIGLPTVIATATATDLRDLYRRHYRPENTTIVVVGDADPAAIEARIKGVFGDWRGVGPAGAPTDHGRVDFTRPAAFDNFSATSVPTGVALTVLRPWDQPADSQAERRRKLVESLGDTMFDQRLDRLVNRDGSVLLNASVSGDEWRQAARSSMIGVVAKDGEWTAALALAETERRRALTDGFSSVELKRALAETATLFRTTAQQGNTRDNRTLAGVILGTADNHDFVTLPAWRLGWYERIEPTITLAEVNAAFNRRWTASAPLVHVSDKHQVPVETIAASFTTLEQAKLAPAAAERDVTFAYAQFGAPGRVVEDHRIADLGIRSLRFANGVRLNLKRTDFEQGKVRFQVRQGGGQLALPRDKPGLGMMIGALSVLGGTGRQSLEDLKLALAGHNVSVGMTVGGDAFISAGATGPEDLALQMKLSAAYLTDPGFRPEAASRWANLVPIVDQQIRSQPTALYAARARVALTGGDDRFGAPEGAVLLQRSQGEARALLGPIAASAPIEIGLVGDIDEAQAITAVAASFGALPPRGPGKFEQPDARVASLSPDRRTITLTDTGPADQALAAAVWPTDDDQDYRRQITLGLLANLLDLQLTDSLREKLGATYSVEVGSDMSDLYAGFGLFSVSAIVAPGKIGEVEAAIAEAARALGDKPVDADLLARARNPGLEAIDRNLRDNGYWLAYVGQAQGRPERLDRIRTRKLLYRSITAADLQAMARRYLTDAGRREIHVVSDRWKAAAAPAKATS